MRLHNINPLDNSPLPTAPSLLVHTQSFIDDIKSRENSIMRIFKIATLETCPIVFTPVNDKEVNAVLEELNLDMASYYLRSNQYIVKCNYIEAIFSSETDSVFAENFEREQGYSLNDSMLMNSDFFHYHLSKTAPRSTNIVRLLDILQVYHVKNSIFKVAANDNIGQFCYDILSTSRQIPNYKTLFISFDYLKGSFSEDRETIENLLQSLDDRMMLMNKSVVELKYQSLKTLTSNASSDIMYHLSYFVILVTSSFDNMAWIINYIYGLNFSLYNQTKNKVKWQNVYSPQNKPSEVYYKSLAQKSPIIHSLLLRNEISCFIDSIYPLRDAIQHRSFIKPLAVGTKDKHDKLLIWFPNDVREVLERRSLLAEDYGFQRETSKRMNRDYYDIYVFSKKVHQKVVELINTICGMIDLPHLLEISEEDRQNLTDTLKRYYNHPMVGIRIQEALPY
jgi:hypothetical protein